MAKNLGLKKANEKRRKYDRDIKRERAIAATRVSRHMELEWKGEMVHAILTLPNGYDIVIRRTRKRGEYRSIVEREVRESMIQHCLTGWPRQNSESPNRD